MTSKRRRLKTRKSRLEYLEARRLLAAHIGRQSFEHEGEAPFVSEVLLKSPTFTPLFIDHIASKGLGSAEGHLRVEDLEATFPWAVNEIRLQFSENVDVIIDDLLLSGETSGRIDPTGFSYNSNTWEATWLVPELNDDKFSINLANHIQARVGGRFVDGDPVDDADESSPFHFRFSTLAADLNRDGRVTTGDLGPFRVSFGQFIGSENYIVYHDANADGRVTSIDLQPFRENFGDFLPANFPESVVSSLPPGISKLEIANVDEDSGPFEILFDVNSSASVDGDLQFTIESSDASLIDASKAVIEPRGDHYALVFDAEEDEFGTAQLSVGVIDSSGTTSFPFDVVLDAVNDQPFVKADPPELTLTHGRPDRTLSLDEYFDDVDDAVLNYRLTSYDSELVTAAVENGELKLTGVDGQAGDTLVVVEATDAAGLSVSASISVEVDRPTLQPLTELHYSLVSDQIVEYHGQNTFIIETNFDESSRIEVESTNPEVINLNDVTVNSLGGGRHRVIVRHTSEDYGLAFLRFHAQEATFADVAVIVTPASSDQNTGIGDTRFEQTSETTEGGKLRSTRAFNDRFFAKQIHQGAISPDTAFALIRPTSAADMSVVHSIAGSATSHYREALNGVQTGRVVVSAEIPTGTGLAFNPLIHTRAGDSYIELLGGELWRSFNDSHLADLKANSLNILSTGASLLALTNPYTAPFGFTSLLVNGVGGGIAAIARTHFITNPGSFEGKPENLTNFTNVLASTTAYANTAIWKGLVTVVGLSPPGRILVPVIQNAFVDYVNAYSGFVTLAGTFAGNKDATEDAAMLQAARQLTTDHAFFTEASASLTQQWIAWADHSLAQDDGVFTESDLLFYRGVAQQDEIARDILLDADTFFTELADGENVAYRPPTSDPGVTQATPTQDGTGENGDQQETVNGVATDAANGVQRVSQVVGVGKKVYDIVKSMQGITKQVGQLFEAASSNAGDYTDNDGETYNLFTPQRGQDKRTGNPGRDIINTGYLADEVYTYAGDDRISTLDGDDFIDGGEGRNTYFAGPGADTIVDGSGGSAIFAGEGADTIYPGAGNDLIEAGTGHDTIVFDVADIGNNLLIDPSRSGLLRFTQVAVDDIVLRKDGYDLEIILPSTSGRISNSVKFNRYFEHDAAGWELSDSLGNTYSLYELTGRITSYEALEVAFRSRGNAPHPIYPEGFTHIRSITDANGRFTAHIAEDRRLLRDNSMVSEPGLVVTFEGDGSLEGWMARNEFGSLETANKLITTLLSDLSLETKKRVTVVGVGEGGLIAQWFSAIASTRGPDFVNTHLVNSPDISGLISQVVRSDIEEVVDGETVVVASGFEEYVQGYRVLSTNFIVNHKDWVSRVGLWAGNDETYASWKVFDFDHDPLANLNALAQLVDVQAAHIPTSDADFSTLQISDMDLSQVRGVVSLIELDDFSGDFANIDVVLNGEEYDSTTNASIVMFDGVEYDRDFDFNEDTKVMRKHFLELMREDPQAVDQDDVFSLKLDFQAASQLGDHLAPFHNPVTELTIYTPEVSGLDKYGWESLAGIKDGKDKGRASSLERDSVKVQDATFIIDLTGQNAGPGTYNISITVGDREEIQESLQININGYPTDRVSTMPGDFLTRTYQISTLDPQLRISFEDIGGQRDYFSVNGVTVEKVNYRSIVGISESLDNDPSVVVLTQSYELPETSAGIEIYKEALKAAAMAAATAGVGAVLGATSLGAGIAAKVGGSLAIGAAGTQGAIQGAAALSTALSTKAAIWAGVKASLGSAIKSSVLGSLVTSVPQNFISDPTTRGILSGATSIFYAAGGSINGNGVNFDGLKKLIEKRDQLGLINSGLKAINGGLTIANASASALRGGQVPGNTAPWIYEVVNSLATMTQRFRLGKLDTAFVPVDLEAVEEAIAAGKTPKQLLKHWQGSREFLVLDWVPTRDKLTEIDVDDHLDYVKRTSKVLKKLLEAYAEHIQESSPESELDLLFLSHGAGYEINRETANRLNTSDIADALDYVKFVTLDPYASSQDAFTWYHPEMTNIVDRVDNIYQTTEVGSTLWAAGGAYPIVLIGASPGSSELYHGGSDLGGLDGREGGGSAGFYNRQARIFDLASTDEILRFRHWDTNSVELSTAELTDIEFSPDGTLVAASGKDGMVTVRYVDDAPEIDPETGKLPYAAGDVKFIVWGQEAKVRSVAFMQMEVDGVWKDFLLTISAANNVENTDIDKNKVLLTDVETGLPVWQGKDVAGTQVEASPSGNVIVSTDSKGQVKVWKRVDDTVTFEPLTNLVEAHTGPNSDYVADVVVINDDYFVTAGLDGRMKLFRITDDGGEWVQTEIFDNPTEGKVRNLDYDPYNGILAVAAGEELSLWRFDQTFGVLTPFAPEGQQAPPKFSIHDHVADIQGVAFSKPAFLLDEDGRYNGDRTIADNEGTVFELPRTEAGDIDLSLLDDFLADNGFSNSYTGLKLITGGEDKTLFLYTLDSLNIGTIREESVLSGSMLPIREVTISPDGQRVAVVGEDNIDGDDGGPVKDRDVTAELDDRLGWKYSELFQQGRREHNAVPQQYIYDVVEEKGESYFWMRNSGNANRPGDLDKSQNLALPPNKRDNIEGVDIAPIDLYLRPGKKIEIFPLQWLLEVDRKEFAVNQDTLVLGDVKDVNDDDRVIGTIKLKRSDSGQIRPNTFVFEAADDLDYTSIDTNEFRGTFKFDVTGPADLEGNLREINDAEITFRIINHKPTTYRDIVNLHPNREEIDLRPRANDYDFDNDDFGIIPVASTWQPLFFGDNDEEVAQFRRNGNDSRGVDIKTTVEENRLIALLEEQADADRAAGREEKDYISVEFEYQVKEDKYKSVSTGIVEVRLQLQAGPENVRYSELGADQVLIEWDPVTWSANKYVIEKYVDGEGWIKHSQNSDIDGNQADSLRIKIDPNTEYWIRVVAKNTNSGREHASHEEHTEALYIPATDYVGPGSVAMESLGPAQMEVRWEKVFWNVDRYRIDLHQLVVGDNGLPIQNEDGSYQYVEGKSTFNVVQKGDGLRTVFKGLDTSAPYLAIVTAKNTAGTIEKSTPANNPVFTGERQLPAGIDFERIGPEKARISWGTVSYADKYRVVAIDPVTLARITSKVQKADNSKNTNDLVLTGLSANGTYAIIIEAKTKKTGEWITLIDDDPQTPILPNRDILAEDISAAVNAGVASTYIIHSTFTNSIATPSLQGLFEGSEFTLLNFARQSINVTATDGTIKFPSGSGDVQSLPPAFGEDGNGAIVYRFVAREESDEPGTLFWEVQIGDELSEARVLRTPAFLAAEPFEDGDLLRKSPDSKPRQLKIDWTTPFWDVSYHRLEVYNAVLQSDGTYTKATTEPIRKRYFSVNNNDRNFDHLFSELTPATHYIVRLETNGPNQDTVDYEQVIETPEQDPPTGVDSTDVTLDSFKAIWNAVTWNAENYRVNFVELDDEGDPIESTRDYVEVSIGKVEKTIEGLSSGVTYQFTVDVYSNFGGGEWIENELLKTVTIKTHEDLAITGFDVLDERNRQIDFTWTQLDFERERLYFELKEENGEWYEPDSNGVAQGKTSKTLEGLPLNTNFDVRLVAEVIEFDGSSNQTKLVYSDIIQAKTDWGIDEVKNVTVSTARLVFPRFADADKYQVVVKDEGGVVVYDRNFNENSDNPRQVDLQGLPINSNLSVIVSALRSNDEEILTTEAVEFVTADAQPARPEIDDSLTGRQKFTIKLTQPTTTAHFSGYRIRVRESSTGEFFAVKNSFGTSGNNLDMDRGQFEVTTIVEDGNDQDLKMNQEYVVEVFATYDGGEILIPLDTLLQVTTKTLDAPTDLIESELGHTSFRINWGYSTELREPRHFRIRTTSDDLSQISPEDANWVVRKNEVGVDARAAVVDGLMPGILYYVQVRAVYRTIELDDEFLSADTEYGPVKTTEAQPVENFRTTDFGKQQIELTWDSPEWTPVAQYIEVKHGTTDWTRPEGSGVQVDRNYNTISKLIPNTVYQVRHVAVIEDQNGNDVLVPTQAITVQTEAYPPVPGFKIDEVTFQSARGKWEKLSEGGATTYRLRVYLQGSNDDAVAWRDFDPSIRKATMSGLAASTNYQMEVQAIKDGIVISSTGRQSFTTLAQPAAPTNVQLSRNKWRALTVSWTRPTNWTPSNYTVRVYTTSGQLVSQTNTSGTTREVTSLTVGASYYATVTANGTEGNVTSQASSALSTFGRVAPTNFNVTQTTNVLTFRWNHHCIPGLPATGFHYRIERLGGDGVWKRVNNNQISGTEGATSQSFSIQWQNAGNFAGGGKLERNKTYNFRVIAVYNSNLEVSNTFSWQVL